MKYFYDTEFLEGTQNTGFFRQKETVPTIDLISIGIVAEDGREYYAVSKEFNLKEAWNRYDEKIVEVDNGFNVKSETQKVYWIRDNVLLPLHYSLAQQDNLWDKRFEPPFEEWKRLITFKEGGVYSDRHFKTLQKLIAKHGKTRENIADDVIRFCMPEYNFKEGYTGTIHQINGYWVKDEHKTVEIYGYYSAYDHVALCWLFGKMMNLPEGFPMYTRDLKQVWDTFEGSNKVVKLSDGEFHSTNVKRLSKDYPVQENEHHALADAWWNRKLYDFIQTL